MCERIFRLGYSMFVCVFQTYNYTTEFEPGMQVMAQLETWLL